ncbi:MAG: hypothetical protein LC137_03575 [Burkholderiales bacterium]|nr:hypothetical protein [Burkholderiales bacterium]
MTTRFPFSFVRDLAGRLPHPPEAPDWLVRGTQHRLVLLANHVLMQEPQAMERLARQRGRVARVQWRAFHMAVQVTPAGMLDRAAEGAVPDLNVELTEPSPLALARGALTGARPAIRIDGDVQLAGDIHWLAENLRWDVEDDLARLVGDVPAHTVCATARRVRDALGRFAGARRAAPASNHASP